MLAVSAYPGTNDYWGPFYSLDSAIGLAMATGNLETGSDLCQQNKHISDAGWRVVLDRAARGSHIYGGDHGGVILMARDNVLRRLSVMAGTKVSVCYGYHRTTESHLLALYPFLAPRTVGADSYLHDDIFHIFGIDTGSIPFCVPHSQSFPIPSAVWRHLKSFRAGA